HQQPPVGQPVEAVRDHGRYPGHDLALARRVTQRPPSALVRRRGPGPRPRALRYVHGHDLAGTPVGHPQPVLVPAGRLAEGQAGQQGTHRVLLGSGARVEAISWILPPGKSPRHDYFGQCTAGARPAGIVLPMMGPSHALSGAATWLAGSFALSTFAH